MAFQESIPLDLGLGQSTCSIPLNPFYHRVNCSLFQKIKIGVFFIPAVILRGIPMLLCVLVAWIFAHIGICGMSSEETQSNPLPLWRRVIRWITARILLRGFFFFGGFYYVNVKGRRVSREDAPILVVSPHSSPADILVVCVLGGPSVVAKASVDLPIVGTFMDFIQRIYVQREEGHSRVQARREIEERSKSVKDWPQIYIYPEGTTTNRSCLIHYQVGAFIPGVPVQPVLIRFPNEHDTVTWTFDGLSMQDFLIKSATQLYLKCDIELLPVYKPTIEEKQDAKLYANNVQKFMARQLEVPVTDFTRIDGMYMQKMFKKDELLETFRKLNELRTKLRISSHMDMVLLKQMLKTDDPDKWMKTLTKFTSALSLTPTNAPLIEKLFKLLDPMEFGIIDTRKYIIYSLLLNPFLTNENVKSAMFQIYGEEFILRYEFVYIMESVFGMSREDAEDFYSKGVGNDDFLLYEDEFFQQISKSVDYLKLYAFESQGIFVVYPPRNRYI